jgi:hypothetical protein
MHLKYMYIEQFVRCLPHEKTNFEEVLDVLKKIETTQAMRPVTLFRNMILDGHHRFGAIKLLYEKNPFSWRSKLVPVWKLNNFEVFHSSHQRIYKAALTGNLLPQKSTLTFPRSHDKKLKLKSYKLDSSYSGFNT